MIMNLMGWKNSGWDVIIGKHKAAKVIDFCHPSLKNTPAASYSLLQNRAYDKSALSEN
jgi:hypothetical protein